MTDGDGYLITLVIGTASLVLLLLELRSNHVWNQKRTSYELMNEMITSGRMTGSLGRLQSDYGWDILNDPVTYADVAARLGKEGRDVSGLDQEMVVIMRHLEMLSISITHGIVSERICRDGFWSFFAKIYQGGSPFIDKERERRNNPHIYERFEHFARKWANKGIG